MMIPILAITTLVKQWRAMAKAEFAEGPIPGDEGHTSRWTAVEMCADDLEAVVATFREPEGEHADPM